MSSEPVLVMVTVTSTSLPTSTSLADSEMADTIASGNVWLLIITQQVLLA